MTLEIRPISYREACRYVEEYHRHNKPPRGWKFGCAAYDGDQIVGVAMAGRPVARGADNGLTLEVNRVCTTGTRNACSKLYAAVRKAGAALGYKKIITYTQGNEDGASVKAAGFVKDAEVRGRDWTCQSRPRARAAEPVDRVRWAWKAAT